jgi:hypothetical protein
MQMIGKFWVFLFLIFFIIIAAIKMKLVMRYSFCFGLILFIISLMFFSCESEKIDPVDIELPEEKVSFSQDIFPLLSDNCTSCHSGGIPPDLSEGKAYNSLMDGYIDIDIPEKSELYTKISEGHPFEGVFTQEELALLLKWIEEGAENN